MNTIRFLTIITLALNSLSCEDILTEKFTKNTQESQQEKIALSQHLAPEVLTAFQEIEKSTRKHNEVIVQGLEQNKSSNGSAYSARLIDAREISKSAQRNHETNHRVYSENTRL